MMLADNGGKICKPFGKHGQRLCVALALRTDLLSYSALADGLAYLSPRLSFQKDHPTSLIADHRYLQAPKTRRPRLKGQRRLRPTPAPLGPLEPTPNPALLHAP
jgi:hypothetical protein